MENKHSHSEHIYALVTLENLLLKSSGLEHYKYDVSAQFTQNYPIT